MKTLGDLIDALDEIKAAELRLDKARKSILHGGNDGTMRCKHAAVLDCQEEVLRLRDQPLLFEQDIESFIEAFFGE